MRILTSVVIASLLAVGVGGECLCNDGKAARQSIPRCDQNQGPPTGSTCPAAPDGKKSPSGKTGDETKQSPISTSKLGKGSPGTKKPDAPDGKKSPSGKTGDETKQSPKSTSGVEKGSPGTKKPDGFGGFSKEQMEEKFKGVPKEKREAIGKKMDDLKAKQDIKKAEEQKEAKSVENCLRSKDKAVRQRCAKQLEEALGKKAKDGAKGKGGGTAKGGAKRVFKNAAADVAFEEFNECLSSGNKTRVECAEDTAGGGMVDKKDLKKSLKDGAGRAAISKISDCESSGEECKKKAKEELKKGMPKGATDDEVESELKLVACKEQHSILKDCLAEAADKEARKLCHQAARGSVPDVVDPKEIKLFMRRAALSESIDAYNACVDAKVEEAIEEAAPPTSPTTPWPTSVPTQTPTASPTTASPTTASPTTTSPTASPTTASPTASPTTASPTASPTTASPTYGTLDEAVADTDNICPTAEGWSKPITFDGFFTCSVNERVAYKSNYGGEEATCKGFCEENSACKYIYFQSIPDLKDADVAKNACHLYGACETTRRPVYGGTTFANCARVAGRRLLQQDDGELELDSECLAVGKAEFLAAGENENRWDNMAVRFRKAIENRGKSVVLKKLPKLSSVIEVTSGEDKAFVDGKTASVKTALEEGFEGVEGCAEASVKVDAVIAGDEFTNTEIEASVECSTACCPNLLVHLNDNGDEDATEGLNSERRLLRRLLGDASAEASNEQAVEETVVDDDGFGDVVDAADLEIPTLDENGNLADKDDVTDDPGKITTDTKDKSRTFSGVSVISSISALSIAAAASLF